MPFALSLIPRIELVVVQVWWTDRHMGEGEQVGICGTTDSPFGDQVDRRLDSTHEPECGWWQRQGHILGCSYFLFSLFSLFFLFVPRFTYVSFARSEDGHWQCFLFCFCLLSLLSVFSSHTGSSAICLLVSQFSCLRFSNVVFLSAFFSFLHIDRPTDDRDGHLAGRGRC